MKNFRIFAIALLCLAMAGLAACGEKTDEGTQQQGQQPQTRAAGKEPAHDDWLGKWNGPEGTYLKLSRNGVNYEVAIKDLDKEEKFTAIEVDGTLQFQRGGVGEAIRHGTGTETGMKWLADKKDCLVIKPGEGYCRD